MVENRRRVTADKSAVAVQQFEIDFAGKLLRRARRPQLRAGTYSVQQVQGFALMPIDDYRPHSGDPLFREIIRDFDSLARLIERAIDHFSVGETASEDLERLRRAKDAVELGAKMTRSIGSAKKS